MQYILQYIYTNVHIAHKCVIISPFIRFRLIILLQWNEMASVLRDELLGHMLMDLLVRNGMMNGYRGDRGLVWDVVNTRVRHTLSVVALERKRCDGREENMLQSWDGVVGPYVLHFPLHFHSPVLEPSPNLVWRNRKVKKTYIYKTT